MQTSRLKLVFLHTNLKTNNLDISKDLGGGGGMGGSWCSKGLNVSKLKRIIKV